MRGVSKRSIVPRNCRSCITQLYTTTPECRSLGTFLSLPHNPPMQPTLPRSACHTGTASHYIPPCLPNQATLPARRQDTAVAYL
jgi:hypothetical protein